MNRLQDPTLQIGSLGDSPDSLMNSNTFITGDELGQLGSSSDSRSNIGQIDAESDMFNQYLKQDDSDHIQENGMELLNITPEAKKSPQKAKLSPKKSPSKKDKIKALGESFRSRSPPLYS